MSVPTTALTQVAATAVHTVDSMPGTRRMATYMIRACPIRAVRSTATQPTLAEISTRTGRKTRPTTPAAAATAA